jgi:hypothetical protein
MLSMFLDSVKLFLRGKLFRDNVAAFRSWIVGFLACAIITLALAHYAPLWLAAVVGGLVGGAAMPWLFRSLKYN